MRTFRGRLSCAGGARIGRGFRRPAKVNRWGCRDYRLRLWRRWCRSGLPSDADAAQSKLSLGLPQTDLLVYWPTAAIMATNHVASTGHLAAMNWCCPALGRQLLWERDCRRRIDSALFTIGRSVRAVARTTVAASAGVHVWWCTAAWRGHRHRTCHRRSRLGRRRIDGGARARRTILSISDTNRSTIDLASSRAGADSATCPCTICT